MITISTNIGEVFHDFESRLDQIRDADKILRTVALDGLVMITDRVQQKGRKQDGSLIGKPHNTVSGYQNKNGKISSRRKRGTTRVLIRTPYSQGYAKERQREGRQIAHIDLTMTGDMFSDFVVEPTGEREYSIGFRGDKSAQKAEYLEMYFGEIFSPTAEEEEFLSNLLEKKLDEVFGQ